MITSYKQKLFLCFFVITLLFATGVVLFEQSHERKSKTEALAERLDAYALTVDRALSAQPGRQQALDGLLPLLPENIRLTLIDRQGVVLYDNAVKDVAGMENHALRPEIRKARDSGTGTDIRISSSNEQEYLYYARQFAGYCVRVALPCDIRVRHFLKPDSIFIYYMLLLFSLMLLLIHYVSGRFGNSIRRLRDFTDAAENDDTDAMTMHFPKDELGEIGAKIARNYLNLRDSQRLKREMTGNITHELRTPVTSIRGYLETILEHPLSPEKERHFITKAWHQVLALSELIRDMSLITRIEDAPHSFQLEAVDVGRLLDDVRSDLEIALQEKDIRMEWSRMEHVTVNGNRNLLYSVFRNLTDNVIRHAGNSVRIQVDKCGEDPVFHHFSYSDTGAGIPDEQHLSRLFERFYRINEGRTRDTGGSGLGLSIVKNAIVFHNGTIVAKNKTGGGLEFLFKLPRA
jgi:signal transduction histidine kinase